MSTGVLRKVCHWGPITALSIIKLITFVTLHNLNIWFVNYSLVFLLNNAILLLSAGMTLYHFLDAMCCGPGYVPTNWKPENPGDMQFLQQCRLCDGYKAPRSHHCRKCKRCVKQMDHHCPWINSCVGWANHRSFTLFLFFAVIGCLHASIVLIWCLYNALIIRRHAVRITIWWLSLTLLAVGFAIGIIVAVGLLLCFQVRGILRNRTTIEDWIMDKCRVRRLIANEDPLKYPYDLGWKRNFAECIRGPNGDGISWPLADGCGPYDLTLEQLKQKADKRSRTLSYVVKSPVSGYALPFWAYPRASIQPPCDTETRLKVTPGTNINVTRSIRHWLYGEVVSSNPKETSRGWVPRAACQLTPPHED